MLRVPFDLAYWRIMSTTRTSFVPIGIEILTLTMLGVDIGALWPAAAGGGAAYSEPPGDVDKPIAIIAADSAGTYALPP